jgi:two-component system response regulator YesN
MLKIFLVEDEFVVREGIKSNINWAENGFDFCGDAADGELAYPLIKSKQPDIIITDIRMPFMNGLELSRLIKKELPQSKIIILSGHEEFSYAQEAIKIGVTEYLLKPIDSTELIKTIKHVAQQIILERMRKENFERYKREMEENETSMKRELFNGMIEGSLSIAEILEHGKKLGLELSAQYYRIVLFKYSTSGDESYSSELLTLSNELKHINKHYTAIIIFDRGIEGSALLIKGNSPDQLEAICKEYLIEIKAVFARYPSVRYFGGIGSMVGRLTHLSQSFESAARAFSYRFLLDENAIISCDELSTGNFDEGFSPLICASELNGLEFKKADAFLRSGDVGEIAFFVEGFLKSVGSTSHKSFLLKQYILMDVYITVLTFLKEIGAENVSLEEPFTDSGQMYEKVKDFQKAKDYIIRILATAIEQRDAIRTRHYHRMIEQAKEYINKHYADENISLNETAAYLNISPSYFSAVFSRETGKSFIRYLTDVRMKKAKELLKCTDLRCSDISIAVGYKDPHYFSYLFKKLQSCSPMQYRTSIG